MRQVVEMYDAYGRRIDDAVLRNGGRVRVPLMLTDAETVNFAEITRRAFADTPLHKPGSLALADTDLEARDKMLDARDERLCTAWRNPPAPTHQAPLQQDQLTAPLADVDAAVAERDRRLTDAWKGPVT